MPCRYHEFRVLSMDTSEPRVRIDCVVVHTGRRRDFFGFNRAKHAVLEAAFSRLVSTAASRRSKIGFALAGAGRKTGGDQERQACFLARLRAGNR